MKGRRNPWTRDGWIDASAEVSTPEGEVVWRWRLGVLDSEVDDVQTDEQVEETLIRAVRAALEAGVAEPGDDVVLRVGSNVLRRKVVRAVRGLGLSGDEGRIAANPDDVAAIARKAAAGDLASARRLVAVIEAKTGAKPVTKASPSTRGGDMPKHLFDDYEALREFCERTGVRDDWHEPDEQGITARLAGSRFDNAGRREEEHVVLRVLGVDVHRINLATLLALAARGPRRITQERREELHQEVVGAGWSADGILRALPDSLFVNVVEVMEEIRNDLRAGSGGGEWA